MYIPPKFKFKEKMTGEIFIAERSPISGHTLEGYVIKKDDFNCNYSQNEVERNIKNGNWMIVK